MIKNINYFYFIGIFVALVVLSCDEDFPLPTIEDGVSDDTLEINCDFENTFPECADTLVNSEIYDNKFINDCDYSVIKMINDCYGFSSLPEKLGTQKWSDSTWTETFEVGINDSTNVDSVVNRGGRLTQLTIGYTSVGGFSQLSELPIALNLLDSLKYLNLSFNNIESLPDSLNGLSSLTTLRLDNNKFTIFPEVISDLASLNVLKLNNNEIDSIPSNICDWQMDFDEMNDFDVSNNNISPPFPTCLDDLIGSQVYTGCTDPSACNFDSEATNDDDSCEYKNENECDCDGAQFDDCGVCGGDNWREIPGDNSSDWNCISYGFDGEFDCSDVECDGGCFSSADFVDFEGAVGYDVDDICCVSGQRDECDICDGNCFYEEIGIPCDGQSGRPDCPTADICGVPNGNGKKIWYVDNDGDSVGCVDESNIPVESCTSPSSNYVLEVEETPTWYYDSNGDGWVCEEFMSEDDYLTRCDKPGSGWIRDYDDVDVHFETTPTWYIDNDGDGLGNDNADTNIEQCESPQSEFDYVLNNSSDIDDSCGCDDNTYDECFDDCGNCNGSIELTTEPTEGAVCSCSTPPDTWKYYCEDADNDGLGDSDSKMLKCGSSVGWVTDCSDIDDGSHCETNNIDDCTGACLDEGEESEIKQIYCKDEDGDGWGAIGTETELCSDQVDASWVSIDADSPLLDVSPVCGEVSFDYTSICIDMDDTKSCEVMLLGFYFCGSYPYIDDCGSCNISSDVESNGNTCGDLSNPNEECVYFGSELGNPCDCDGGIVGGDGECCSDVDRDDCGICFGDIFFGDEPGNVCDCIGNVLDACGVCGGDGSTCGE